MHFEPQAVPAEIAPLLRRFVDITTWEPWADRFAYLKRRVAENAFLGEYFAQKYPLELTMMRVHRRMVDGQGIDLPLDHADIVLFSFVAMVARVHPRLSRLGQGRLAGMLRSGLDSEVGLAPLAHEMSMAAHLMGRGFEVTFSDMELGGGFDLLAERDGAALEVECKTVSGDLGRKIHLRRLYQLGGRVHALMASAATHSMSGQLTRILLPGRLHGTDEQMKAIWEQLAEVFRSGRSSPGPDPCTIDYREFSLAGNPFETANPSKLNREDVRQYVEQEVGLPCENAVILFGPRSGVVMVAVASRQEDAVVGGLVRQLKDCVKRQFSGRRPGAVCVKFLDITQAELLTIVEQDGTEQPSALKLATSYLLRREDWVPVHTLAYLTPCDVVESRSFDGKTLAKSIRESGHTYTFANPHNRMANDPRYSVF